MQLLRCSHQVSRAFLACSRDALVASALLLFATQAPAGEDDLPRAFNAPRAEGYSIDLVSVEPAPGTPLVAGTSVEFRITVSYPQGSVTLTDTVTVPKRAKELRLFVPLVPKGLEETNGEVTIR